MSRVIARVRQYRLRTSMVRRASLVRLRRKFKHETDVAFRFRLGVSPGSKRAANVRNPLRSTTRIRSRKPRRAA